jgi:hypothetical protein
MVIPLLTHTTSLRMAQELAPEITVLQLGRQVRFYRGASFRKSLTQGNCSLLGWQINQKKKKICLSGLGRFSKKHVSFSNLEVTHNARWYLLWPKITGHICIKPSAVGEKAAELRAARLQGWQGKCKIPPSCGVKLDLGDCLWVTALTQKLSPWGKCNAFTHKKREY